MATNSLHTRINSVWSLVWSTQLWWSQTTHAGTNKTHLCPVTWGNHSGLPCRSSRFRFYIIAWALLSLPHSELLIWNSRVDLVVFARIHSELFSRYKNSCRWHCSSSYTCPQTEIKGPLLIDFASILLWCNIPH